MPGSDAQRFVVVGKPDVDLRGIIDLRAVRRRSQLLARVQIIHDLEEGKEVEKTNYMEEKVFTKENVDEYIDDRNY